jgi:hypothetical protein
MGLLTKIGAYKAWALHLPDLAVVPGFPTLIQGPASNDATKYFIGGEILQRPGLAMIGNSIIAGFGGHCDSMNYVSCTSIFLGFAFQTPVVLQPLSEISLSMKYLALFFDVY